MVRGWNSIRNVRSGSSESAVTRHSAVNDHVSALRSVEEIVCGVRDQCFLADIRRDLHPPRAELHWLCSPAECTSHHVNSSRAPAHTARQRPEAGATGSARARRIGVGSLDGIAAADGNAAVTRVLPRRARSVPLFARVALRKCVICWFPSSSNAWLEGQTASTQMWSPFGRHRRK